MMATLARLKTALQTLDVFHDDTVKAVFDHIRNVSLSMLVGWAGLLLVVEPHDSLERLVGVCLVVACVLLFLLNMANGVRRILASGLRTSVKVFLCVLVVGLSVGLFALLMRQQLLRSSLAPYRSDHS